MIRCYHVAMVLVSLAAAGNAADPAAPASARRDEARILVLTGNEYPGHKWQETAPLIARFLEIDRRLTAEVNADPQFLASSCLSAARSSRDGSPNTIGADGVLRSGQVGRRSGLLDLNEQPFARW